MMKKLLALLLVLALALGALALTATATTDDDVDYRVGYAMTDINPYWSVWEAAGGSIPTDVENYSVDQNGNPISSDHIMPLPMGGYGGNTHRLSRPELIDDNGTGVHADGVVYLTSNRYTEAFAKKMLGDGTAAYNAYKAGGFGQNDGDGIYATCVSIQQNPDAEPVLMFSVDLIHIGETYTGQAKNVIIRELKKVGIDITPDRILINSTHTHGAVSLGESFTAAATYNQKLWGNNATAPFLGSDLNSYLDTYEKHLYSQLAAAAVQALTDGQTNGSVVMQKGTLDVSDATGYQLNGVRHRKAQLTTTVNGVSQTVDYVTGSSFNVDFDGETEISGVSESDDRLHVLQFSFPDNSNVEPILMVNWRAHTTANNKMNSKAHNNLSADFVAPMRTQLEQWGYRFILNYSASGNLGMGNAAVTTYNISTSATDTTMNATAYGQTLAFAAAYLAGSDHADVATWRSDRISELYAKCRYTWQSTYSTWIDVYKTMNSFTSPGLTTCTQGEILLETTYYNVAYQSTTDAQYQAALYHDALAVDEGGSASNDGGLKLEITGYPFVVKAGTYTANGESFTIDDDVVIASQYHSNSMKKRNGTLNAKRISLTAFMLGDSMAFVTVPFEASDRYSMDAELDTANDYNDWDALVNEEAWGTPFVMSLTNGSEGYVPNNLAYTYTKDLETLTIAGTIGQPFVSGSYEAHTAYAAAGQGEKIVAELNTLLRNLAANGETEPTTKSGYCEACKTDATWIPLNDKVVEDNNGYLATGHYYLAEDFKTVFGAASVYLDETVCLDLNGQTYYSSTNTGASRVFNLYGTLNVMDSVGTGVMKGKMAGDGSGGSVLVSAMGTLNLYSGTLTCDTSGSGTVQDGGVVYVPANGTFNMYGGTVRDGKVSRYGGNVHAQNGTFNMYGGTITGGSAQSVNYANLMISANATFRFASGYIPSGAYVQGALLLGNSTVCPINTSTTTLIVRNKSTVTLDGIFTGKVKLNYSNSSVYPTSPADGDTIGAVVPGSWIDHVNGAKISATSTSSYEGVVDGELLKLGTKPATGYCNVCKTDVIWMPMVSGAVNGHFVLTGDMDGMAEQTVPAYGKLCLDLKGHTYTASARAFTVNGTLNIQDTGSNGTLQGTAVAGKNGGTVYVAADGTVNQYSGTLTCDHASKTVKITNGGVVYVAADGSYTMHDGTITGGYAGNGGNVHVAAGAEFFLEKGTITAGNATTAGGNVYTYGAFTMNGGSISEGTAGSYGGNVHAQGKSAVFTMTGGTVTGGEGSSNICTGPNKTDDTSTFRMEGGSVVGTVYVQGKAVLAGTTTGTVNITSKVPAERLTIEGTYTGTIKLKVNGASSVATGEKIGISDNADISGATIEVEGATATQYVAVVGNELQMAEYAVTGISVTAPTKTEYWVEEELDTAGMVVTATYANGHTAQITDGFEISGFDSSTAGEKTVTVTYKGQSATFTVTVKRNSYDYYVGDTGYNDLNEAMGASTSAYPVVLQVNVTQAVTMTCDAYLDLNGHDVASVTTGSYKLYCLDSQTDDYAVADGVYGTITNADANVVAVGGYMAITEGDKTSYHKLTWGLTNLVVNTEIVGITYKANFQGDEKVKEQVREFGVAVRAYRAPDSNSIWLDTEGNTHMALDQSKWQVGKNDNTVKCVYVTDILLDALEIGTNQERAEILIFGICYIKLQDGTMLFSASDSESLHTAMEYMNSLWNTQYITADDQTKLQNFYTEWENVMSGWTDIGNIKGEDAVDIPVL